MQLPRSCGPTVFYACCSAIYVLTAAAAVAQESGSEKTTPTDVYMLVGSVRTELEELRFLMGRPQNRQKPIAVKGAAPREVYFQALTLFQKADRLCFEHTRERAIAPEVPQGAISPADVHRVVSQALSQVRKVKSKYGIDTKPAAQKPPSEMKPTDVFQSIVEANRQLNLMLDYRIAPSDVYEQVTRCIGYTERLLEQFPDSVSMPDAPPHEAGKQPADVYRSLLECVQRVRTVAKLSGLEMLELEVDEDQIRKAEPSDVYDVASLVVAELTYLHRQLPGAQPPRKVYYVGRKFPSQVYQRAGLLQLQLLELERLVEENPQWLKQPRTAP